MKMTANTHEYCNKIEWHKGKHRISFTFFSSHFHRIDPLVQFGVVVTISIYDFCFLDLICTNHEVVEKYYALCPASLFTAEVNGLWRGGVHNKMHCTIHSDCTALIDGLAGSINSHINRGGFMVPQFNCTALLSTLEHLIVLDFSTLHLTPDTWHLTLDTWHLTPNTWHMTCDTWWGVNILLKFQLPSSYGLGLIMFWSLEE